MDVTVRNTPLSGKVHIPASKSDAHRALICAALAARPTEIGLALSSEDIDVTARCLTALGAGITRTSDALHVTPIAGVVEDPLLDCGESGSTLRFLLPVAAAVCARSRFTGRGKLPQRPAGQLLYAMCANGCSASSNTLPLALHGRLRAGVYKIPGDVSSQFISGLLMALPGLGGNSRIVLTTPLESAAYVQMTVNTLQKFGVRIDNTPEGYGIPGGQRFASPGTYRVETDWSGAAFFVVANALGGNVAIGGLDPASSQPDKAIAALATALPAQLDVSAFPDLFPILAIRACAQNGDTLLHGARRLRIKESDRIRETCRLIHALGGRAEERPDALLVHGTGKLHGGACHSAGDHRIAMSAAIAAAICETPVTIKGAQAAYKSFPGFWAEINTLSKGQ